MNKRQITIFDEKTNKYIPVIDKRDEFRTILNKNLISKKHKLDFIQGKLLKLEQHPDKLTKKKKDKISIQLRGTDDKKRPIPGGVGYGVYYNKDFRQDFTNQAHLDFSITIPTNIGGNLNSWLYLTATNGTAKGVEALVSYDGQSEPTFSIFDWSIDDSSKRWAGNIAYGNLTDYISNETINGNSVNTLRVLNSTSLINGTTWQNEVSLYNIKNTTWDLVYSNTYQLNSNNNQMDDYFGSWGPIVETFQTDYSNITSIGFSNARLYNNSNESKLLDSNSVIRKDVTITGINIAYIDPNWTFLVN
jgi:hypothetical protein